MDQKIPDDVIIENILVWLPIKQITQCKILNKHFNKCLSSFPPTLKYTKQPFISHSSPPLEWLFIDCDDHDYYIYSLGDDNDANSNNTTLVKLNDVEFEKDEGDDRVKLVGCSKGLVCFGEMSAEYFILWNPTTNEHHKYYSPDFELLKRCGVAFVGWGFGYVTSSDDYKVVRRVGCYKGRDFFHVFSLRSNTWRKLDITYNGRDVYLWALWDRPKLANETLYWQSLLVSMSGCVAFDLGRETLELYPHLEVNIFERMCVIGGCLSKCARDSKDELILHIVKQPGMEETVRLPTELRQDGVSDMIGYTKTGKIVSVGDVCCARLSLVDLQLNSNKFLVSFPGRKMINIERYVPSQISPRPPPRPPAAKLHASSSGHQVA